ncbi:eCIS core domain-containing protein [Sphaerisporangium rhizosphaerae]|uniref:DUF4157 domain-containing protein n=1 Tax=Sphaerisporangium rhizosphaerae TaxID=2269375 RepID=A0ABW2PFE4_9ACTN
MTRERAQAPASSVARSASAARVRPRSAGAAEGLRALARAAGNRAMSGALRSRLPVTTPHDAVEQEAERTATAITSAEGPGDGPAVARCADQGGGDAPAVARCADRNGADGPAVARCADQDGGCSGCGGHDEVRRAAAGSNGGTTATGSSETGDGPGLQGNPAGGHTVDVGTITAGIGGGHPLRPADRDFFEDRLGADLDGVRIHTGGAAERAARAVRAKAFTVGTDVVFGQGRYAPETPQGRHLLAHELTHVVQQAPGALARAPEDGAGQDEPASAWTVPASLSLSGLAGAGWLSLSRETKERLVDKALDVAAEAVGALPDNTRLGLLWPFFRAGLAGFIARLRSPEVRPEEKVRAMDKIAGILAGRNAGFNKAFLTGLARGFFIDGMLGVFVLVYDLVRAVPKLWQLLGQVADAIGGLPEEMAALVAELKGVFDGLRERSASLRETVLEYARNPQLVVEAVSRMWTAGKDLAREKGGDLARALVDAVNAKGSEQEAGTFAGEVTGQALWEVAFAAATAGGGAAVTGVKAALKPAISFIVKIATKIEHGFIAVFRGIHSLLEPAIGAIRKIAAAARTAFAELGERLAGFFERIRAIFRRLLGACHESKLVCHLHHSFPKYLRGWAKQTLTKIPAKLHRRFHRALSRWKGGILATWRGAAHYAKYDFDTLVRELRAFYKYGDNGRFAKYLPDLENAIKETRSARKKGLIP